MRFDHIALACENLDTGAVELEKLLGFPLSPRGQHPHFGTHNRLISLGGAEYLELIAIDPDAPDPGRPRWFDLDRFSGAMRLTNWILALPDVGEDRFAGFGAVLPLARGDYRWRMRVPDNGVLPNDGLAPALISWDSAHPALQLPDHGLRLKHLTVSHPNADGLRGQLDGLADPRIELAAGAAGLRAVLSGPNGDIVLPC